MCFIDGKECWPEWPGISQDLLVRKNTLVTDPAHLNWITVNKDKIAESLDGSSTTGLPLQSGTMVWSILNKAPVTFEPI